MLQRRNANGQGVLLKWFIIVSHRGDTNVKYFPVLSQHGQNGENQENMASKGDEDVGKETNPLMPNVNWDSHCGNRGGSSES